MNEAVYRAILARLGRTPRQSGPPSPDISSNPLPDAVIAQRARAFRAQLEAWTRDGGPGVPLLTLPDAPPPEPGRCVSCGAPAPTWRCTPCLRAVHLALDEDT